MLSKDNIVHQIKSHRVPIILLVCGIVLMLIAGVFGAQTEKDGSSASGTVNSSNNKYDKNNSQNIGTNSNFTDSFSYADTEEKRLAEFLKKIKGVGDVEVIIYVDTSSETVNATENNSSSSTLNESDTNGGLRESVTESENVTYKVIKDSNGNEQVIPIYTKCPEIVGIAVAAEGAGSSIVKEDILEAIKALYGIPVHKVSVHALS